MCSYIDNCTFHHYTFLVKFFREEKNFDPTVSRTGRFGQSSVRAKIQSLLHHTPFGLKAEWDLNSPRNQFFWKTNAKLEKLEWPMLDMSLLPAFQCLLKTSLYQLYFCFILFNHLFITENVIIIEYLNNLCLDMYLCKNKIKKN